MFFALDPQTKNKYNPLVDWDLLPQLARQTETEHNSV
jgi:hypothetical protein